MRLGMGLGTAPAVSFLLTLLLSCSVQNLQEDASTAPTGVKYTVTYHANGATSGSVPAVTRYEKETIVTVAGNTGSLAKTDLVFSGWNTKANGTGRTYTQGEAFAMKAQNLVLYARWTAEPTYQVLYDANGATSGSVPVDSTNYEQGMSVTVAANTGSLVKTGYSFLGWNTKADGTGTSYASGATFVMAAANVTLYVKWGAFTFPSGIDASLKGVLLTNPDQPAKRSYLYITSGRDLYSIHSSDGGVTWGSAIRATYTADLFDFAAAMDGNSTTVVEIVRGPTLDGTNGEAYWLSHSDGAGSWSGTTTVHSVITSALCRLPSVCRVGPDDIVFGVGYDTSGGGVGNDTNGLSLYWTGSAMAGPFTVGLHAETDNPSLVAQIFGESNGNIQYLYMDNHTDWTSGDAYIIPGTGFTVWAGWGSETRVIDAPTSYNCFQPYLFKTPSGTYVLVYTMTTGSSHAAYMKTAASPAGLSSASDVQISSPGFDVRDVDEGNALYHTMYAAQDSQGAIHVVWEDKATSGKIWRCKIDPTTLASNVYQDITANGTLHGVSSLPGVLYVSLKDSTTWLAVVVQILNP